MLREDLPISEEVAMVSAITRLQVMHMTSDASYT